MKKTLTLIAFLFLLGGCSKEKVETSTDNYDDVVVFTVKSDGYMGTEKTYEEFNKQLNDFFKGYDEEKDVIATLVEPRSDFKQHTITIYYFADSIDEKLATASDPVAFAKYRNSVSTYSDENKYMTNRPAAYDENVNERFFNIGLGEYNQTEE